MEIASANIAFIKAIKIGKKVSAQTREEFKWFNAEHVGEDSILPTKNNAPKILEQLKTSLIRLNFVMNSRRAISPNYCPQ